MMDWTDRHCRYFLRGFGPDILLYTEMITAQALLHGDAARLLRHAPEEHPLALQLGGSDPELLARAAALGAAAGYDEINLNCGCPSERVQAGAFGARLMLEPGRVADCVRAMRAAVDVPVTVKMRIGAIAGADPGMQARLAMFDASAYQRLTDFTAALVQAGCEVVIVHAREAVLGGLSPKENRDVPPLRPEVVQRLRRDFPQLTLVLNGGLRTLPQVAAALGWCDGVMLGREAYHRPSLLAELQQRFGRSGYQPLDAGAMLERMACYAEIELRRGEPLSAITRHMLGLRSGQPGARAFRRLLSEGARRSDAGAELLRHAARRLVEDGRTA
ncbi:MAG: tRNA dihydrouridine(20/20a) synthase DusA [Gammaproteobacteria bacterium]|nr:tRNA dihydrouridine(20/20a) synthase DusA [Gammaproteobacteria bacterium]